MGFVEVLNALLRDNPNSFLWITYHQLVFENSLYQQSAAVIMMTEPANVEEEQKQEAEGYIAELTAEKYFKKPIVTEVVAAQTFWDAEEYHQNYYEKYEDKYGVTHRRLLLKPKR